MYECKFVQHNFKDWSKFIKTKCIINNYKTQLLNTIQKIIEIDDNNCFLIKKVILVLQLKCLLSSSAMIFKLN